MDDTTPADPTVEFLDDGPLKVTGLTEFTGLDGAALEPKPELYLCRCGGSKNKPHCDGTHAGQGFTSARSDDRVPDRLDTYAGRELTVLDNRGVCSHAGICSNALPKVFHPDDDGFAHPDEGAAAEIVEAVRACPSGALTLAKDPGAPALAPAIRLDANGPYLVEGAVELVGAELLAGHGASRRSLCRCGGSRNKPFCDGQHYYVHFRDDDRRRVTTLGELKEGRPLAAEVLGVDLVVVRRGEEVHVLSGACAHQGALMSDGEVDGARLVCGLHGWSYDLATGEHDGKPGLHRFTVTVDERWGEVLVDLAEVRAFAAERERKDPSSADGGPPAPAASGVERHVATIHELAQHGLARTGDHGPMDAMGVPRDELPSWDDLQFVTAQLHELPLLEDVPVGTGVVIGPRAARPLQLAIPIFVSDMSFGALSFEAKLALSRGAELAGTGICSGEGGMLPEEQAANSRYFYELASARFGFEMELLDRVQAFHFKGGQGAKTGTGGHLPGDKVTAKIAAVRGLAPGQPAVSPPRFPDWDGVDDYRAFADQVRERTGGIPIGFKLSAQHIEMDLAAALRVGCDYVILDGRGGGTGAAPLLFRDNISVPTLPALARARKYLNESGNHDVTLVITGGLRTPADFAKALALGADAVAISNSALQAIGCIGARACHTNNCPTGIATQKEHLRRRLVVDTGATNLARFLDASVHLMATLARACGHDHLGKFSPDDLTTWRRNVAYLTGVRYGGVTPL
jgi:glutamate synthase domain-containing protein 2/CDGSH-type Zn-finger protein